MAQAASGLVGQLREIDIDGRELRILQSSDAGDYAGSVWDCALVLCNFLSIPNAMPHVRPSSESKRCDGKQGFLCGLNVLELGSGTGLCGITAALFGARVWLTDRPACLPLLRHNVNLNKSTFPASAACSVQSLEWDKPVPAAIADTSFDLIIASDVVYDPQYYKPLVDTLLSLTATPSTKTLLSFETRSPAKEASFFELLAKHFEWHRVKPIDLHPTFQSDDIALFILQRRVEDQRNTHK